MWSGSSITRTTLVQEDQDQGGFSEKTLIYKIQATDLKTNSVMQLRVMLKLNWKVISEDTFLSDKY